MKNKSLKQRSIGDVPLSETYDASRFVEAPMGPFSNYCPNQMEIDGYLDRLVLDFRTVLPKRFVSYLTPSEAPRTIRDLLNFPTETLMERKYFGILTVNQIIHFLNNIPELDARYGIFKSPDYVIGYDIRSCFLDPGPLFSGNGHHKISWFEGYLPAKFVTYLKSHPEIVTINDLLGIRTKKLLREKQIDEQTLREVLGFLCTIPEVQVKLTDKKYQTFNWDASESKLATAAVQEDETFCLYDIMEIYYSLIHNLMNLPWEKDRFILRSRFVDGKTLDEIAVRLRLTQERVRQVIVRHINILKRPLAIFEVRFKSNIVQLLSEMSGFIDEAIMPEESGSIWFVNVLSYIYPFLPTRANRLSTHMIGNNKYLSRMQLRLLAQDIVPYRCTFRSLCRSMGITGSDDAMNLYRIILCGNGVEFEVKDGAAYVVRNCPVGGF